MESLLHRAGDGGFHISTLADRRAAAWVRDREAEQREDREASGKGFAFEDKANEQAPKFSAAAPAGAASRLSLEA